MSKHEIGLVYRRDLKYFIAVSGSLLVNGAKGLVTEVRPNARYDLIRSITVEELCGKWNISLDQFDTLMSGYLNPSKVEVKSRPRGSRRSKTTDDEFWRLLRTNRISQI